jgi:hypothetical protein
MMEFKETTRQARIANLETQDDKRRINFSLISRNANGKLQNFC